MPILFSNAEAVQEVAERLLGPFHPEIASARIKYIFREKASNEGGKPCFGKARKLSGEMEFLIDADFLITVALDLWNEFDAKKREAGVDHLLECCTGEEDPQTGNMVWKIRKPDVREFTTILQRHGVWHQDLEGFVAAAQACELSELEEPEEGTAEDAVANAVESE